MHSPPEPGFNNIKISEDRLWFFLLIIWFAPNTQEIMSGHLREHKEIAGIEQSPVEQKRWYQWHPNQWWAALIATLFIVSTLKLTQSNEFIYFQF